MRTKIIALVESSAAGRAAVYSNSAHENEPLHAGLGSLPRQAFSAMKVNPAEFLQRIHGALLHDMNTGGKMNHRIDTVHDVSPVGIRSDGTNRDNLHTLG